MIQHVAKFLVCIAFTILCNWSSWGQQSDKITADSVEAQNQFKRAAAALVAAEQNVDRLKAAIEIEKVRVLQTDVERQLNGETIARLHSELGEAESALQRWRTDFEALKQQNERATAAATQKGEEERKKEEARRREADKERQRRAEADAALQLQRAKPASAPAQAAAPVRRNCVTFNNAQICD